MKTLIDRLSLRAKFAIAGLVGVASMLTALGVLVSTMNENIAFSAKERLGVAYHKPLRDFLAAVIAAQADPAAKPKVVEAIAAVDKVQAELGTALDIGDRWEKIRSGWQATSGGDAGLTPVIEEAAALMDHVGNTSNLILDPDLDSYYLMDIAVTRAPHLARKLAFLREQGAGVLTSRAMSGETRTALSTTAGVSVGFRDAVKASVDTAVASNADLKTPLQGPLETLLSRADAFLGAVERDVLSTDRLQLPPAVYRAAAEQALAANFAFYDVVSPALDGLLEARVTRMTWKRNVLVSVVVGLMMLAGALGIVIVRGIVRSAHDAAAVAERMARGDLDFALPRASGDELGAVIRAMGSMKASLDGFVAGQQTLAKQHAQGLTSHRMDAGSLPGTYGEMAGAMNALVSQQLDITERLVAVVEAYAQGDFSAEMAELPGEQARITEACRQARTRLLGVAAEIQRLSGAAAQGDFDVRGDESRYDFAYREMVGNLNRLMEEASRGIDGIDGALRALADGDLTHRVDGTFQGRFGVLQANANTTTERLRELVGIIHGAVGSITTGTQEIAAGNQDLSERTERQASSLQETASSMEELTSTVQQNADNARQANQLVIGASEVAVRGGEVVRQVVSTMGEISESSKKIVDIISVIDGIAFQTNILALNAAVEAARAGEQGRGFAVVATEVRNLAQRSAAAAKEIKALIGESVGKVETGSELVDRAGRTMEEIVVSVKRVTDIMAEITAASVEQSSGIEQVNQAITQMDEVTQQNAALVEEAAAAAESLEEQARGLADAVAVFRVEAAGTAGWDGRERRGPDRATNVSRLPEAAKTPRPSPAPAKALARSRVAGGAAAEDEWETF